jgi:hypothetical protein
MRRYRVVVVTHSGDEHEFTAVTSGGFTKAAYMAGSAFGVAHPRTGIATFRVEETAWQKLGTVELVDRMEW